MNYLLRISLFFVCLFICVVRADYCTSNSCDPGYYCGYGGCQACNAGYVCGPTYSGGYDTCSSSVAKYCTTCTSHNCTQGWYYNTSVASCVIAPASYYQPSSTNANLYYCPTAHHDLSGQVTCLRGESYNEFATVWITTCICRYGR
jgi:hypothetical protein